MKKIVLLFCAICLSAFCASTALADEPIDLTPKASWTAPAEKNPEPAVVTDHELNEKDVEKLARLLWSSPLRDECYKKELVWVVMNRAAHGAPFCDSIQECISMHEFSFYQPKAHKSEENLRIVREAMNQWLSKAEGNYPGAVIRPDAFYISFYGENNKRMHILDLNRDLINWDPVVR